jgi:hypothetical protein
MQKLGFWINKALMFDLFLVFFFFVWFVLALGAEQLHLHLGLNVWHFLWQPVIQPVLGIMMAGAILSGIIGKLRTTFQSKAQTSEKQL